MEDTNDGMRRSVITMKNETIDFKGVIQAYFWKPCNWSIHSHNLLYPNI